MNTIQTTTKHENNSQTKQQRTIRTHQAIIKKTRHINNNTKTNNKQQKTKKQKTRNNRLNKKEQTH